MVGRDGRTATTMEFQLLGDIAARHDGVLVDLGHTRQRCVLACLLIEANRPVPIESLVERVWADRPPHRAREAVYTYVSRLRTALAGAGAGDVAIERHRGSYLLSVDLLTVDLHRFRALVDLARNEPATARAGWEEALALWRGPPFGTVDTPWFNALREELDRERHAAWLERNDGALRAGRHAHLVAELTAAASADPLDERLTGQLMLALHRSGRQNDAFALYRSVRRSLADELGTDPGADLQRLYERLLHVDDTATTRVAVPRSRPGSTVPRHLPAPPRMFTGRDEQLAELDEVLIASATAGSGPTVCLISGTAGVGKTSLAVHWSHRTSEHFPDGQLYVNLRGFDPSGSPMPTGEAVRVFLDAFEVPPQRIPTTVTAQVGLYRSLLADRRVLVVLDNAGSAEQARQLLPASTGCAAVVTSRTTLRALVAAEGAHVVALDPFDNADSNALLARRVGTDRMDAEPDAAAYIVSRCAGLPLALTIVAARATLQREFPLSRFAAQMRATLDQLETFDDTDGVDVRDVFSWSYRTLSPQSARLFRLLSVHPGPDITPESAASLCGEPVRSARRILAEIAGAHLAAETRPGRYALHDLLRAYADELARLHDSEVERTHALVRTLDHYLHTADNADGLLYRHREPVELPEPMQGVTPQFLDDSGEAIMWFVAESSVLLAVTARAQARELAPYPWLLLWTLSNFLTRRGLWSEWITAQLDALRLAEERHDQAGRALAHRGLSFGYRQMARVDEADEHARAALHLYVETADVGPQAQIHLGLGANAVVGGRHAAGLQHFREAERLYAEAGNLAGLANALNNVGWTHALLGHYERTIDYCTRAIDLQRRVGDGYMEGTTWDSLGFAQHNLGRHTEAIESYGNALHLIRLEGDWYMEAETLDHIADSFWCTGDRERARAAWEAAATILDDLADPRAAELHLRLRERARIPPQL